MSKNTTLYFTQIVILVTFLTTGFLISVKTPLLRGRDELAHFRFTRFIAQHNRLPITWEERDEASYKSGWPPLFHLIVGTLGQITDINSPPYVNSRLTENNPRVQLVYGPEDVRFARALVTEDPYQGELLLWYLGRWTALLIAAITIVVMHILLRAFYPHNLWPVLSVTAFFAFVPNYIRNSTVVSYEPLVGMTLACYWLLLFHTIQNSKHNYAYLGLGLLLGIAGLTKYTPLVAVPVIFVLILWFAYTKKWTYQTTLLRIVLFGAGLFVTFGIWLLYVEIYFNQVPQLGFSKGLLHPFLVSELSQGEPLAQALTGDTTLQGQSSFLEWAGGVLHDIWWQSYLIWIFLGLLGFAVTGTIRQWRKLEQSFRLWIILLIIHIGLFSMLPFLRFLTSGEANTNTIVGQHFVFSVGVPLTLLIVYGLNGWFTPPRLAILFAIVAGLSLWQVIVFITKLDVAPLPIQSVPLSENEQVLATFGEIALIDYQYELTSQLLTTTLFWRANNFLAEDYYIELTLLDAQNQPQARWVGQPLNGRYPTRAWITGDRVRDTTSLPVVGLQGGDYQLQLRVLDNTKQSIGDSPFNLGVVIVGSPLQMLAGDTLLLNGMNTRYNLWSQNQPTETLPLYKERATITFSTSKQLPDNIQVKLVGSDGQAYEPVDHTGNVYSFMVKPHFASGQYHFRFERWSNEQIIEQVETTNLLQIKTAERQFEIGSVSHPIQANFTGQVALIGYDLPQRKIKAGDKVPITLHWQALKAIGTDLITFNRVINEKQQVIGEKDRQVRGVYSTLLWAPNEIISDPFEIQIDSNAPDGIYYFLVGLYLPVGESAVSLPLVQDGKLTNVTSVRIGPIKVGQTPSHFVIDEPTPQHIVEHTFGNQANLKLIGYDLDQSTLTLYWQLISPLAIDYTTFIHIRNEADEIIAQKDQPPLEGAYPTGLWDVEEIVADEITIPLPNNLSSGKYRIVVGMYDFKTGQRLSVPDNPANELVLTAIQLP